MEWLENQNEVLTEKVGKRKGWSVIGNWKILVDAVALGGDLKQNLSMVLKEFGALEKEMKTLRQRAKLVNLYHNYMEEF